MLMDRRTYEMAGRHGPSYMASKQFASGMLDYLGKGEWPIGAGAVKPDDIVDAIKKRSGCVSRNGTTTRWSAGAATSSARPSFGRS